MDSAAHYDGSSARAPRHWAGGGAGFTFIELLVAIATLAVLAALLLAALSKAKAKAQSIGCLDNLAQLQLAWLMYPSDNAGKLVRVGGLDELVQFPSDPQAQPGGANPSGSWVPWPRPRAGRTPC